MNHKVKTRLMIAGAAFCAALFLFSGAMLAREYLDQKQSHTAVTGCLICRKTVTSAFPTIWYCMATT